MYSQVSSFKNISVATASNLSQQQVSVILIFQGVFNHLSYGLISQHGLCYSVCLAGITFTSNVANSSLLAGLCLENIQIAK